MLGSWSLPADPHTAVTLRTALSERLGERLRYAKGTDILSNSTAGFDEALDAARTSDVTILTLGESGPGMTGEATSRAHLELPGNQEQLLEAVMELGKPVVLVLFSGRPLAIPWAAKHVPAILEAWAPGAEGGHAIADVLFGDISPSGRLPVSFPYSVGQEPLFYSQNPTGRPATGDLTGPLRKGDNRFTSRYIDEATVPLFPFGWGLTYTMFQYSTPVPNRTAIRLKEIHSNGEIADMKAEIVVVDVTVTNTGSRTGTDVVQLYLRSSSLGVEQPLRRLCGFQRITLAPHESRVLHFTLSAQDLALYDADMKHVIGPALYTVFVGGDATTTNSGSFRIVEP